MSDPHVNTDALEDLPEDVNAEVPEEVVLDAEGDSEADGKSVLDEQIASLSSERDQFRDSLQRLQADFENYRKRMIKQQTEGVERANESLVAKMLPVLDTIDLAKAHEPSGSLEQISVALLEVLTKEGLERINAVETPFDPNLHEAVAHEPGEGDPKVSEDLRAGYTWKGRVLRPSMVKVVG